MSWFDDLFSNKENSDEELLRRKSKRRNGDLTQNKDDSLLPENNDIYDRPRGKFRFPIDVGQDENYEEAIYRDSNDDIDSYRPHSSNDHSSYDSFDYDGHTNQSNNYAKYDSSEDSRRRRRRNHINQDDTGIPSIKSRSPKSSNKYTDTRESQRFNKHQNNYSSTNVSNYSKSNSNHQSRVKLQSERFKSNYHLSSEPTYHRSSFKTSEVPSAIFGTKKRRPIENGVIPPVKDDEDSKESTTKYSSSTVEHVPHESNHGIADNSNKEDTKRSSQLDSSNNNENESTIESSSNTSNNNERTPNYSKRDNTVNIENIYASQIVEEIRKERERKVQQKRKFKEALQNKRQQTDEEDSIQRAIDEMYAKQAEQYTGESSLNQGDNVSNKSNEDEIDESKHSYYSKDKSLADEHNGLVQYQNDEQTNSDKVDNQTEVTNESHEPYNYEEIDLNKVSSVQQVSQDDVQVKDVSEDQSEDQSSKINNNKVESYSNEKFDEYLEDTNSHEDMLHDDDLHDQVMDDGENEGISNKTTADYNDEKIDDANYREINESESLMQDKANDLSFNEEVNNSEDQQNSSENNINNAVRNAVSSDIEYATNEDEENDERLAQDTNKEDQKLSQTEDIQNESFNNEDVLLTSNTTDDSEHLKKDSLSEDNKPEQSFNKTNKAPQKMSIKPGSKPFNVVMTPSDKKRIMDAKKNSVSRNKVNVPELKPETKKEAQDDEINAEFDNHLNETQLNSDESSDFNVASLEYNESSEHSVEKDNIINDENTRENEHQDVDNSLNNDIPKGNQFSKVQNSNNQNDNKLDINEFVSKEGYSEDSSTKNHKDGNDTNHKAPIRRGPNIKLPSLDLLEDHEEHEIDESWIEEKKQELNDAFYYFNVPAEVQNVTEGPSVTRFELAVEKGVKVSRITALQDDIKMALAAKDIRIEAPIPGTSLVGIEVPNLNPTKVNLKSILESPKFKNAESKLTVAMGNRINNEPLLMDIAKTPHALIAGATGSGKSVCINSILMSLLYKNHPEELRLLLIDPKMVELEPYNDLPHLVSPVITDVKAATQSLKWAVDEMEKRYKLFAQFHVRNITAFNKKAPYEQRMPKIVIVIDELADLMMMAPQEVEQSIARIAQKARACGIHMLVATQRPSVNVITGLIKANIPTRIAFMVSSSVDSRTILDSGGAERLLGYGDMLYLGSGMNKPIRVQGTFVSDDEIDDVVDFIKDQREPDYLFEEKELLKKNQTQAQDELFDDVCEFMVKEGHISTSLIQRHFQIGYNRAARIVDQLEQLDYISGANGSKPRDVFITEADLKKD
ncbi:DNA translocase FtsK [Staphylococcus haemolyticus]|uniref:DNA translocase FtsK n=1 Tax=Staphylococcus haemolyticus TaxID=1283 RepID=UPI001F0B0225|nr:DNA translocase FtsK [Staphylococcus haemolyticus]MCH4419583.1 DNA translocase FtsK [Staphylococcus haemolyticus]